MEETGREFMLRWCLSSLHTLGLCQGGPKSIPTRKSILFPTQNPKFFATCSPLTPHPFNFMAHQFLNNAPTPSLDLCCFPCSHLFSSTVLLDQAEFTSRLQHIPRTLLARPKCHLSSLFEASMISHLVPAGISI